MGLLDQLWDDTLAGPRPDSGLGRLRRAATALNSSDVDESVRRLKETRPVTQSITIVKPGSTYQRSLSVNVDNSSSSVASEPSIPSSPLSACSTPTSPSSSTPRDNIWRTIRAGAAHANANANANPDAKKRAKAEPRAPTVYDWVVITALDR